MPYAGSALPAFDLHPVAETGSTIVVFGGFDSYIEEFLPMLATMVDAGHRVVAFEGPGQGGALEERGLPMIPEWERPVSAVLDHYGLTDVTAVGESLGGGLVIRAAAFEPRISRVVSMDILDDEFEVVARQIGGGMTPVLRALLAVRATGHRQCRREARDRAQTRRRVGTAARHARHRNGDGLRLPAVDDQVQHPAHLAICHCRCPVARRRR